MEGAPNGSLNPPNSNNPNPKVPKEAFVYRHDVVRLKNRPDPLGIVTEVAGDYDSDESVSVESEENEDEEEEDETGTDLKADGKENGYESEVDDEKRDSVDSESLPDGQIRVSWLDHTFTTEDSSSVTVTDRSFLHGDIVTSISCPSGQLGQVSDVHITADLSCPDSSKTLTSISSHSLKRVRDFVEGDFVIFNCWLGRVDDVIDNVTVLFDDGSVCKVLRADPDSLRPVMKPLVEDVSFPYYPGQRVKARSSSVFKSSRWLTGLWKASRLEGVVIKVEVAAVNIYWITSAYFGPTQLKIPDEEQSPKNLNLVSGFSYANWQVADWCHLAQPVEDEGVGNNGDDDSGSSLEESTGGVLAQGSISPQQQQQQFRKKLKRVFFRKVDKRARKKEENFEKALMIVKTETKVDVQWQDGTRQYGVDSTSLVRIRTQNDHDFLPDQFVVEKAPNETDDYSNLMENKRVGLVKSVNARDRTVLVRWLNPNFYLEGFSESKTEMISAYELEIHPDYDYCYGDVVVKLPPAEIAQTECVNGGLSGGNEEFSDAKTSPGKNEGVEVNNHTSWAGNIVGLCDGYIDVVWGDGTKSKVGPHEVYVVGREDDEEGASIDGDNVSVASWETVDDDNEEMNTVDNNSSKEPNEEEISTTTNNTPSEEDTNNSTPSQNQDSTPHNNTSLGPLSMPMAAIGYVTRLAAELFSRGKKDSEEEEEEEEEEERPESEDDKDNNDDDEVGDDSQGSILEEEGSFRHFDVMQSPEDHHFLNSTGKGGGGKKWVKKVQQEWNILQKNLPGDIYVRVFEDRMDLIRAVIVGVPGTPYQDGLFFFDFLLPPEYPHVPPTTYYHSGGLRLNPNLYIDGKVCLSLLNTWTGKGNEVWDPSTSTILQVLVSIQGLVLNEKPYFNEAGYEKQVGTIEGEKNVLPYNENTYLLNLKSILYLIRKPPLHFEEFVRDHFKKRGYYILKACGAYLEGCAIGSLSSEACPTEKSNENSCSVGFKITLAKLLPRLFTSFRDIGVNCDEFEFLLKMKINDS